MTREADLEATVKDCLVRHNVAGASVAVLEGSEVIAGSAGVINVSTGVPMTLDTLMHIGSITKLLTATLVLQLVDEGLVDLDTSLSEYLPEYRHPHAFTKITVRMLLNHTSGLDGEILPDFGHDSETIDKGVQRLAALDPIHAAGAEFSYCNPGFVIAGYLVQRVVGVSWYRLIWDRILDPLQIREAATTPEEALLQRASVGHYLRPSDRTLSRASTAFMPLSFAPAGTTLMMSARGLLKFALAHLNDGRAVSGARILSAKSTHVMRELSVDTRGRAYTHVDGVGLAWMRYEIGVLPQMGGGPGVISVLYMCPARATALAILTNSDSGLGLIHEVATPWLKGLGVTRRLGSLKAPVAQQDLEREAHCYKGTYENHQVSFQVRYDHERLTLSRRIKFALFDTASTDESAPTSLISLGQDRFLLEDHAVGLPWVAEYGSVIEFRGVLRDGRMQLLGNGGRLHRRVDGS